MSRRTEPATMTVTTDVQPYRIGIADPRMYTWGIDAASGQAERHAEQYHLPVIHRDNP
jgi:hypothetical protein